MVVDQHGVAGGGENLSETGQSHVARRGESVCHDDGRGGTCGFGPVQPPSKRHAAESGELHVSAHERKASVLA